MSRFIGKQSEAQAKEYLYGLGLSCIDQNYYATQAELDLIVLDNKNHVYFVEVKYRKHMNTLAYESITKRKRELMIQAANTFMFENSDIGDSFSLAVLLHSKDVWIWFPDAFDESC